MRREQSALCSFVCVESFVPLPVPCNRSKLCCLCVVVLLSLATFLFCPFPSNISILTHCIASEDCLSLVCQRGCVLGVGGGGMGGKTAPQPLLALMLNSKVT